MNEISKIFELCIWYAPQIIAFCALLFTAIVMEKATLNVSKMIVRKLKTGHFTLVAYRLKRS